MDALHPYIDSLLDQIVVSEDGAKAEVPEKVCHDADKHLRGKLRNDTRAFLHLAAAWAHLNERKVQPAAEQILRLLEILPDIHAAEEGAPSAERAHTWLGKMQGASSVGTELKGMRDLGSVNVRNKSKT